MPVTSGGGIRWIVDVEESGLYDLEFKVNSANTGKLNVYIDNTNLTFDNFAVNMDIKPNNDWQKYGATLFLRQGINIVDIDILANRGNHCRNGCLSIFDSLIDMIDIHAIIFNK